MNGNSHGIDPAPMLARLIHLNQGQQAELFGVSLRTVNRWHRGHSCIRDWPTADGYCVRAGLDVDEIWPDLWAQ